MRGIILPLLAAFVTTTLARRLNFFKRPTFPRPPIFFSHVLMVFAIYLGFLVVLSFFLQLALNKFYAPLLPPAAVFMYAQFFIVAVMLITLLLYLRTDANKPFQAAFKNPESKTSRLYDIGLGAVVYFVAFPWTMALNELCDALLRIIFHFENYEQVAVRYLKQNLVSPLQLITALLGIIVIAPIVEEILFRGTLQQYLKKYLSVRHAIFATSCIFAMFHFSPSQGLGNLAIIPSLLVFACFLGYTYERQGSLYASIGLHATFNLATTLQILLLKGT